MAPKVALVRKRGVPAEPPAVAAADESGKPGVQRPAARAVERVARDLLAPILDGRFRVPGWTLVNWDAEQGICLTFENAQACILLEFERRNDRLACYARTRRFNVCARRPFEDSPLSATDRGFVNAVIAVVRAREGRIADFERPTTSRRVAVREVLVDRVLIREGGRQYYINPYVGCMIGCPFCYVIDRADFSRQLEGLPQLPWGQYLDVKVNAAEVLRREVASVRSGIVRMSPIVTDPYQSVERHYRITRQCLEVLVDTDLVPVVLTRAPRILDDIELLKRFRKAVVAFSIPTDDDQYRRIFEPGADPIEERLEALRTLHAAGIRTAAVIQPVLPMNPERLVAAVAPYVLMVRLDRMHMGERVRPLYEAHGLSEFATEEFASTAIARLASGFRSHGVEVDSLDNLERLVGP